MTGRRRVLQNQQGVSLIELLVAVVMFALLVLMIDGIFISAHRSSRKVELGADVQQNARIAVERLTREIREAGVAQIRVAGTGDAVVFKTARLREDPEVFCLDVSSGSLHDARCFAAPGPSATPADTFTPVWQRYIGYRVFVVSDGRELRRYAGDLTSSGEALPADPNVLPASAVETVIAKITNKSAPSSALTFGVQLDGGTGTFSVDLQASGEEIVQGSGVPVQQLVLSNRVNIRN